MKSLILKSGKLISGKKFKLVPSYSVLMCFKTPPFPEKSPIFILLISVFDIDKIKKSRFLRDFHLVVEMDT